MTGLMYEMLIAIDYLLQPILDCLYKMSLLNPDDKLGLCVYGVFRCFEQPKVHYLQNYELR